MILSVRGYVGAGLSLAQFGAVVVREQSEMRELGRRPAERLVERDVLWR